VRREKNLQCKINGVGVWGWSRAARGIGSGAEPQRLAFFMIFLMNITHFRYIIGLNFLFKNIFLISILHI